MTRAIEICRTLPELRRAVADLRQTHPSVSLVPTMGALHAGHAALVTAAAQGGAGVVASIFVNPLQFAPTDDFSKYPRDEAGDLAVLEAHGCHIAWMPSVEEMYPPGDATTIEVAGPALLWEGAARPGHFRGVATVCARLFGQVRPDRAYFGEKDWQQVQVVSRMVADLLLPLEIVPVPTVREPDGLAMSSRNRFLGAVARSSAKLLHARMAAAARAIAAGADARVTLEEARVALDAAGFATDYLAGIDPATMAEDAHPQRLIAASRLGGVRLLDTMLVPTSHPPPTPPELGGEK